jgi:hypothetical protein
VRFEFAERPDFSVLGVDEYDGFAVVVHRITNPV